MKLSPPPLWSHAHPTTCPLTYRLSSRQAPETHLTIVVHMQLPVSRYWNLLLAFSLPTCTFHIWQSHNRLLTAALFLFECGQVQEKKVKKICDMNMDPSQVAGNGDIASSSASTGPKACLPNGGRSERPYHLSSDFLFPPGVPSLRLPVVVVLTLAF